MMDRNPVISFQVKVIVEKLLMTGNSSRRFSVFILGAKESLKYSLAVYRNCSY